MIRRFFLYTAVAGCIVACKKAGTGGDHEVSVTVKHHDSLIPGAKVYIAYNAEEFPGTDLSKYDDSVTCGVTGHGRGHAHIKALREGDYFFYSVGFDSNLPGTVTGGTGLRIRKKDQPELDLAIPVTE